MLHNGVPILQSLKISKDSAGSPILADEIEKAAESVRKGEPLSAPLEESGLFPVDILDMIAVAEESNNLENVLIQIADTNEARTSRQVDLAVRLLEPVLLVGMAAMVLCIALALLLPILTMSSSVMGGAFGG
jgi:type II secretory pathway component PulF